MSCAIRPTLQPNRNNLLDDRLHGPLSPIPDNLQILARAAVLVRVDLDEGVISPIQMTPDDITGRSSGSQKPTLAFLLCSGEY